MERYYLGCSKKRQKVCCGSRNSDHPAATWRSRADDEKVHQGRHDSPLTETGRSQAQEHAWDFLARGFQWHVIIASTLVRAHETARIIGAALDIPMETDPDWMEFNNGPLAGLPYKLADERFPTPGFESHMSRFTAPAKAIGRSMAGEPGRLKRSCGAASGCILSRRRAASSTQ